MLHKTFLKTFLRCQHIRRANFCTATVPQVEEIVIKYSSFQIAGKFWNPQGSQTPVLATHGWLDNAGTWDRICPLLSSDIPVLSIDFPGTGYTTIPPGVGTHFMDGLLALHKVLKYFNWDKVNYLGHSMGAGLGMLYAGTFPEAINKLIMVDLIKTYVTRASYQPKVTANAIVDRVKAFEQNELINPRRFTYEEHLQKIIKDYDGSLTEEAAKVLLKRGLKKHDDGLYSSTVNSLVKCRMTTGMTVKQKLAFAKNVTCDMLIIKASEGPLYDDVENCNLFLETYEKACRSFQYVNVEGTHHVHLNDPQVVAPLINDYLLYSKVPSDMLINPGEYLKKVPRKIVDFES